MQCTTTNLKSLHYLLAYDISAHKINRIGSPLLYISAIIHLTALHEIMYIKLLSVINQKAWQLNSGSESSKFANTQKNNSCRIVNTQNNNIFTL